MKQGDKVFYKARPYEIIHKRFGVDMYAIGHVIDRYHDGTPKTVTHFQDGIVGEELVHAN